MGPDLYAMSGRELDTVLAALRYWQLGVARATVPAEFLAMADNGARRLSPDETEALFERLMFAGFAEVDRRGGLSEK